MTKGQKSGILWIILIILIAAFFWLPIKLSVYNFHRISSEITGRYESELRVWTNNQRGGYFGHNDGHELLIIFEELPVEVVPTSVKIQEYYFEAEGAPSSNDISQEMYMINGFFLEDGEKITPNASGLQAALENGKLHRLFIESFIKTGDKYLAGFYHI